MAHPATRILAVLELLQSRGRMTGAELARELGVHGRTVRRYLARLEEMGIPLTTERGRHGGYMLVPGFKLPPLIFDQDEALALAIGLLAARDLGVANAVPAVASARAKLERVMPRALEARLREVETSVQLDLGSRAPRPVDSAWLIALAAAARERRRVRVGYRDAGGQGSERPFDAYGLAHRAGCWYAVGWCHLRKGVRSFRLDRVTAVRELEERFERPAGFDALEHLTRSLATMPRRHAVQVLLETDLETARRELFATAGILEPRDGGVLLSAQADDLAWFARELSRLPFPFTVRRPKALGGALCEHARSLLERTTGRGAR